jgi:hypothetical protein
MAGHGTVKKIEADFRRISATRRKFFASLARPDRWRRTVVAGQAMQKSHDGSFY